MVFQVLSLAIMLIFYGFYIFKMISQNRQSIKTNQMGIGDKPEKVLVIEKVMGGASVSAAGAMYAAFLWQKPHPFRCCGLPGFWQAFLR